LLALVIVFRARGVLLSICEQQQWKRSHWFAALAKNPKSLRQGSHALLKVLNCEIGLQDRGKVKEFPKCT